MAILVNGAMFLACLILAFRIGDASISLIKGKWYWQGICLFLLGFAVAVCAGVAAHRVAALFISHPFRSMPGVGSGIRVFF